MIRQSPEPPKLGFNEFAFNNLELHKLYPWQIAYLDAIGRGKHVSLVAANGSGKSAFVVAQSILAFLARYPKGRRMLVSASHRQILNQIMPALRRHAHLFPDWEFFSQEIKTPEGGFFSAFSVQEGQIGAGRAEGYHPSIDADTDPSTSL